MSHGHKYNVGVSKSWARRNGLPELSDHITGIGDHDDSDRWDERMPADAYAPETVLKHSHTIDGAERLPKWNGTGDDRGDPPQEIRIANCVTEDDEWYRPVFIVRHDVCVTVIDAHTIHHAPTRAYLLAAAAELPALGRDIEP